MKYALTATILAGALASGMAIAQTTVPGGTTPATPGAPSGPAAPALSGPSSTGSATPSLGANSQATPPRTDTTAPAAVSTTSAPSRTAAAPVAGANSFTEGQARARIEDKGFANVTDLKKDDQGVWRGTAMKDGKSVTVALDYQGNIVGQ